MRQDYMIVWGTNLENFQNDVRDELKSGWEVHGNFIVRTATDKDFYYQALVRRIEVR